MDVNQLATVLRAAQARAAKKPDRSDERTSVITLRVTAAERSMLQAVADHQEESLSAFVRNSAIDVALAIVADVGPEELERRYRARNDAQVNQNIQAVEAVVAAAGKNN